MSVHVEFFGVVRQRAGVAACETSWHPGLTLGGLISGLAERFPRLATDVFAGDGLQSSYIANRGGSAFMRDPQTPLADGETVLFLSADAGG